MSKLDCIFSSPCCYLQFPFLSQWRLPRGFSEHCSLILGVFPIEKGWIPFKFMDCWLYHSNFKDIKGIWDEACNEFLGQFKLITKLSYMGIQLKQWSRVGFGN
ncbi:hypothetical protein NC651_002076 [Populus alba x Populus x berolinensis]|nr:hypothetical protein NC651_002076 [Populus alba x Populus x berolinensis]